MTPPVTSQITPDRSQSLLVFWTCCLAWLDEEELEDEDPGQDQREDAVRNELLVYFGEKPIPKDKNPLQWWKENETKFPTLAVVAKSYLAAPATSTPSERLFSAAGTIMSKKRASLTKEHVDMLTFLHSNSEWVV